MPFVAPLTVVVRTGANGRHDRFHYIPIREVLKNMLEIPDVYSNFSLQNATVVVVVVVALQRGKGVIYRVRRNSLL